MEQAILLDTNVLSELIRPQPDIRVLAWFGVNTNAGFYISAVTQAEILLGISLLPAGKRQSRLADAAAEKYWVIWAWFRARWRKNCFIVMFRVCFFR